jgi:hypothetical protein
MGAVREHRWGRGARLATRLDRGRDGGVGPRFGAALVAAGVASARADGVDAFLSIGTRDVSVFGRCGFRVVDQLDERGGGPHVWFMRWDP